MAGNTGRRKLPRFLDDLLRAEQRTFLENEFDQLGLALLPLWHLGQVAYPLDADTAGAVRGLMDHFVLPWGLVEWYIEEWSYTEFWQNATAYSEGLSVGESAWPEVPGLESLRVFTGSEDDRRLLHLDAWPEEFGEAGQLTAGMIREGLFLDYPSLEGRYLLLPYVPLGWNWLSYVPLVDGCWLDRRLIELCEAAAALRQKGFTRVPPLDRHSLAWHRFFPPHTRWREPKEAPRERFLTVLEEVTKAVRTMHGRSREIDGRPFVHVDDYARWRRRNVPTEYLVDESRLVGIPVQRWNNFINEHATNRTVDLYGTILSEVESPLHLREGESVVANLTMEQAEHALEERLKPISRLVQLAGYQPAPSPQAPVRGRQRRILEALADFGPMGGTDLAAHVRCSRRTLYKPGGIRELIDGGLVIHQERKRNAFAVSDAGRAALAIK